MSDPLRILILEDNPADAELVQFELREAGLVFTSKVVMTENAYVEAIRDHCPDLILSDYDLPRYTGALALAEAKKRCPDTPFILVTGAVTEDRAIDILTQGAEDYVLKTRMEQRLVPAVKRALAEAEEHRARSRAEAELRDAHRTLEEKVIIRTAELQEQIETRKRTEEALRDSEERQRLVLQASSMGTFEVDLLTGEGQWNATEFELLGLKPGDVKASPDAFFRFVHPDDVEQLQDQWAAAVRSGQLDAEFRIVRADGQERWLAGKGHFFADGKPEGNDSGTRGEPLRFLGVNFDITERKKAEEAAAAAQRQIQGIIDNTTAVIYAFDLEGRFVMANRAVAELLNTTPEQMIGKRRHEFMPKEDADWHEANDRQTIEAGRALDFEEYSQLRDRSITWFTTKFPLRDAQDRIYGVAGISADVSERTQAQEMLRESEERYRGVVENTTAIILRVDPRGVINFANSRALEFFGYTADELIGRHAVGSIIPSRESSGRDLAAMVDQIVAYPDRFHSNANENICRDGRRMWLEWTNSGIYSADGRLKEILCVGIDATVRRQAKEALLNLAELMDQSSEALITRELGGVIRSWNRGAERLYGWTAVEAVGQRSHALLHTPPGMVQTMETALEQTGRWEGELLHTTRDGRSVTVEARQTAIRAEDGPLLILESNRDITERKRAEEALKLHAAIMETVAEGIFLVGLDDNIIKWTNRKFEQLFGYGPGEMVGMHVDRINAPTERTPTETRISIVEVLRQAGEWHGEIENIKKDGAHFWCGIHVSLFNHPEFGTVMVSAHTDITERKRAEEAVSRSQKTFYDLVERSPFGTYVVDSQFRIAQMNAASRDGAFRNVRPVIGRDFAEAMRTLWPEPVAAEIIAAFRHTLDTGEPYHSPRFINPRHDVEAVESYEWDLHRMTLQDGQYGVLCYYFDSTKLRETEAALRESKRLLQDVIDGSTSPIFLKDTAGKFITINASLERMLGMSREEIKGKTDYDIASKEVADYWWTHDKKVLETGKAIQIEEVADLQDGHHIFLANKFPLVDAEGQVYGVGAISHDITDRKKAEQALKESEERFRALAETSFLAVGVSSLSGEFLYLNKAYENLFGYKLEELRNINARELWKDPKGRSGMVDGLRKAASLQGYEAEFKRKDGKTFWASLTVNNVDFGGNSAVMATVYDITDRKRVEEALRESEERYRGLFEHLNSGALLIGPIFDGDGRLIDFRYLMANPAVSKHLGKAPEEFVGRLFSEVYYPHGRNPVFDTYEKVLSTGEPYKGETFLPATNRYYDIAVYRPTQGRLALILSDITERKQAEEALKERTQQLENANQELEGFNQAMVGRESRMIELKQEINGLCAQLGQPPRYPIEDMEAPL